MERDPHQLIEGCLIACYAIGLRQASSTSAARWRSPRSASPQALNEAYAAGYVGKNILGTDFSVDIVLHWGAGAYIVGEETALIESLEGNRGMPRLKPPFFPAAKGLYMQPTIVNNVETLSNLPWIITTAAGLHRIGAETSPARACSPCRPREAPRRVRGRTASPPSATSSTAPSTAAASATATSSRRSSPAALGPVVLRGAPRPAARQGHRRRGRLDARLGRHRGDGRDHRHGEGVLARWCGSSPASPAASARRAARAPPGSRRSCRASSTATAARATSTCCSTSATTSARGSPGRPSRPPSARSARRRCRPSPRRSRRFRDEFEAYITAGVDPRPPSGEPGRAHELTDDRRRAEVAEDRRATVTTRAVTVDGAPSRPQARRAGHRRRRARTAPTSRASATTRA
jgi:hypothetical protein